MLTRKRPGRASRRARTPCAASRPGATDPADLLSQPRFCAGAAAAFGLIIADILVPGSFHVLAPLDTAVQSLASSRWPVDAPQARSIANAVSNVPIIAALGACAVAGVASGVHAPLRTLRRAALGGSLYFGPGWGLTHKDVPLLDLLKHIFRHTFTAFFFVGCAILLASARAADGSSSPVSAFIRRNSAPLLVLGGVTAVGRVLSDVHWASDTMAGAALAMAVVSFAFCVVDNMDSEGREAVTARDEPADKMIESRNES